MSLFLSTVSLSLFMSMVHSNGYFPVSTKLETCCPSPVNAFIMREFSGDCACQTLEQKWKRYVDWVEISGGYIDPFIEMNYVGRYQDTQRTKYSSFKMHSHERGIFANIKEKYRNKIESKALLMQIPFSISFSQFIISKYIKNASLPIISKFFSSPHHFMPNGFPDWKEFRTQTIRMYRVDSIRGWLALGLAWLKQNTRELLPWLQLLPSPHYLPITWNTTLREEELNGTKALNVINTLQREYKTALPYINMLGLTKGQVLESFAWIASRSFGMGFDTVGGSTKSPVIPCGIDFFNHNVFGDSSMYYDKTFGKNREIISTIKGNINVSTIKDIDFASNYLWINNEFKNTSEMFVNYGKHHTSASRFALFGFIDEVHPYDHYTIYLELQTNDMNKDIKKRFFKTVWNSSYIQNKKYNKKYCYIQYNTSTWHQLGNKRYIQNIKYDHENERTMFTPPLTMEYYGQKAIKVKGNFIRFLRLLYLPQNHFDSFTISSILNDAEYDYLQNVIDPFIRKALNHVCIDELNKYPTTLYHDKLQLTRIETERKRILKQLSWNRNTNLTETQRLSDILSSLDRYSVVIQYRAREKTYLDKCSTLKIEPIQQYLNSVKQRKKLYKKRKKAKNILTLNDENNINIEILGDNSLWADLIQSVMDNAQNMVSESINEDILIENTSNVLSKKELMIGEPKKGETLIAETIGWNSPNARQKRNNQNINVESLDLSQLFGGNIQINNGQIIIGNSAQIANGNIGLNNLLQQFAVNTNNNNNYQEIPETVPFSELMNQATVSVFGVDGKGNVVNVRNTLNSNNVNLAQLFNRKKDKPKIIIKP